MLCNTNSNGKPAIKYEKSTQKVVKSGTVGVTDTNRQKGLQKRTKNHDGKQLLNSSTHTDGTSSNKTPQTTTVSCLEL